MVKYFCDICGKEYLPENSEYRRYLSVTHKGELYTEYNFELCQDCEDRIFHSDNKNFGLGTDEDRKQVCEEIKERFEE